MLPHHRPVPSRPDADGPRKSEAAGDLVVTEDFFVLGILKAIRYEGEEGLHINVVGPRQGRRPGLLEFLHQMRLKVHRSIP